MLYNDYAGTWETLCALLIRSMTNNRYKGRMSNGGRESDSCVVPMTPGNAGRGKAATHYHSCEGHINHTTEVE